MFLGGELLGKCVQWHPELVPGAIRGRQVLPGRQHGRVGQMRRGQEGAGSLFGEEQSRGA